MSSKYQLGARIGGGGMADVHSATVVGAQGFARPVAVKRMLPELSADPNFGKMFANEAQIASRLHHPNIASVLDFDRDESGSYYLVMELVNGIDLRQLLDLGPLPYTHSAYIIGEVLHALSYAHELIFEGVHQNIVHRDVSPHNVMISWDGNVKVVDFGIAKAVSRSSVTPDNSALRGKVGYVSPEQAHGRTLDGRSDLFSVGVVFHEMLTGGRLFRGGSPPEVLSRLLNQPIARPRELRPDVPADLDAVVMGLLERKRSSRYTNARTALGALLSCQSLNPRAAFDLQDLLRDRFPGRAPKIPTVVSEPPSSTTMEGRPAAVARGRATTMQRTVTEPQPYANEHVVSRGQGRKLAKSTVTQPPEDDVPVHADRDMAANVANLADVANATGPKTVVLGHPQDGYSGSYQHLGAVDPNAPRARSLLWLAGGIGFLVAAGLIAFAALAS